MDVSGGNAWIESYLDALVSERAESGRGASAGGARTPPSARFPQPFCISRRAARPARARAASPAAVPRLRGGDAQLAPHPWSMERGGQAPAPE